MRLSELLQGDSPIELSWSIVSSAKKIAEFKTSDEIFGISLTNFKTKNDPMFPDLDYNLLIVSFGSKKEEGKYSHKLKRTSSFPASVLNTVITAIKSELKDDQILIFSAKRSEDSEEEFKKRKRFYEILSKMYERKGYNLEIVETSEENKFFFLSKEELVRKDLLRIVKIMGHNLDKK